MKRGPARPWPADRRGGRPQFARRRHAHRRQPPGRSQHAPVRARSTFAQTQKLAGRAGRHRAGPVAGRHLPAHRAPGGARDHRRRDRPAGAILPAAGSTLADLLGRAGGLTRGAFVFGANLSRQSVRQQQQASFDKAIDDLSPRRRRRAALFPERHGRQGRLGPGAAAGEPGGDRPAEGTQARWAA